MLNYKQALRPTNTALQVVSHSKPKLLDEVRTRLRFRHYSLRTERSYTDWIKRFILFNGKRHPRNLGAPEITAFLSSLATEGHVAASTQNQALSAILFLYKQVLKVDLPWLDDIVRAKEPKRLPVVLNPAEVARLLAQLEGTHALMAKLMYGTGMRLMECVRLRVKDIDFISKEIVVRDGKGGKDRVTMLPISMVKLLKVHLKRVKVLYESDRVAKLPGVYLPNALEKKYKKAGEEWGWYWVFPSRTLSVDPQSNIQRRHHTHEQALQRAVKRAARLAGITKPATTHSLRHSFATH